MDQTPFDLVTIAFEVILTTLVLGVAGTLMSLSGQMMRSYQKEVDVANMMAEYSTYSKYDGTELSGSDVVEAIHLYANTAFPIKVGGTTFTNANYTLDELIGSASPKVSIDKDYKAEIQIGGNGNVSGIIFTMM